MPAILNVHDEPRFEGSLSEEKLLEEIVKQKNLHYKCFFSSANLSGVGSRVASTRRATRAWATG